jgi:hypothetical protein
MTTAQGPAAVCVSVIPGLEASAEDCGGLTAMALGFPQAGLKRGVGEG